MPKASFSLRYRGWWIWAGIGAVTLAAYGPAICGGFIWDDDGHVTPPALRSLHGLWRIWFELGATQQYYPVLHSAFWAEHQLWGDATAGYHLVNILLHATSAFLFGVILRRLKIPGAWLAASIFALHPVCVESVAWISEQKNTLSTVFYLLAALTYLRWRSSSIPSCGMEPSEVPHRGTKGGKSQKNNGLYILATFFFVLALLSKSVTATLPAALLVIGWWQQGRLAWRKDIAPLIPWLAIGVAGGLFTAWVERHYIGAQGTTFNLSLAGRCLLAGRAVCFYLGKLFWPANLIFIYPHWQIDPGSWRQYLFLLGVLGLFIALWLVRRRTRAPLAALLFFVGTLFPALGFFSAYPFIYSYVADHFQYLASFGIIACVAAAWAGMGGPPSSRGAGLWRAIKPIVAVVAIGLIGILTWRQSRVYRNAETLYQTTLERNPQCWMAHTNLGIVLAAEGRLQEAMAHYEQALRMDPYRPEIIHDDWGGLLLREDRLPEATEQFAEAVRINPAYAKSHSDLGKVFLRQQQWPDAVTQFEDSLRTNPGDAPAHSNLGVALAQLGRSSEALVQFKEAVRLDPDYFQAHYNLGLGLVGQKRMAEARAEFERTLSLRPGYPAAQAKLAQLQDLESKENQR